ncbi:MAG: hypothetical protein JW894_10290 [Bacteroidales bacterium]|nr:hypothetical protein [Bacteroidales bacterium]
MQLESIDGTEYKKIFNRETIVFNTVEFNLLNRSRCDSLEFLLFHDGNKKLGLIAGIRDGNLSAPFSAPFSCFSVSDSNIRISYIDNALSLFEEFALSGGTDSITLVLPPSFYCEALISKIAVCLNKNSFTDFLSVNHHFNTCDYNRYSEGRMGKDVRYNIKYALKSGLVFKPAEDPDDFSRAYDVIEINKKSKNRPQSMTFDQIMDMTKITEVDFLMVMKDDLPVASAIIYNHSPEIAQVIYWGDIPEFSRYYPMNFLAFNIFRFYYEKGTSVIDLGTSMLGNEPNVGLINFKDNIGAITSLKFSFCKQIKKN